MKTPEEFLKEISPGELGLKAYFEDVRVDNHMYNIMKRYAEYSHKEKLKEIIPSDEYHYPKYGKNELQSFLIKNKYSEEITEELSGLFSRHLELAYKKGQESLKNKLLNQ